jgi:hypothetical protein
MPVDPGDHRLRTAGDGQEHPCHLLGGGGILALRQLPLLAHPIDVGTRAEAPALARDHDDAGTLVFRDPGEEALELRDQPRVEGVAFFGPIQAEPQNCSVLGHFEGRETRIVHGTSW